MPGSERDVEDQRSIYEPIDDGDLWAMVEAYRKAYTDGRLQTPEIFRPVGLALLARRAAAPRKPVVVTDDMVNRCWESTDLARGVQLTRYCLEWLAGELNGKHEEPEDPAVERLAEILRDAGLEADRAKGVAMRATAELKISLDKGGGKP